MRPRSAWALPTPGPRLAALGRELSAVGLAAFWLMFAHSTFDAWRKSGKPAGLGVVVLELVVVALFVTRRTPKWSSWAPLDLLVTSIGAFGTLAARPIAVHESDIAWAYQGVQLAGALAAIFCLLTLGRSFGFVPANREICTRGPYRVVRHPTYASYLIVYISFLFENPTLRNACVFGAVFTCQLIRIRREERCLAADEAYAVYRRQVRFKLIPQVY